MDFSFTSEQDMLRDTVAKLIAQQYDFDTRRKIAKSDAGWRPAMWAQFAELGLLGAAFSEAEGGFARLRAVARFPAARNALRQSAVMVMVSVRFVMMSRSSPHRPQQ